MNDLAKDSILIVEDVPCSELDLSAVCSLSGCLLDIHMHTGRPHTLCDLVFAGDPGQLSAVAGKYAVEIMPLPVMRKKHISDMSCGYCRIELGCRSLVVGSTAPFTDLAAVDTVIWSAMEAVASGADAVEVDIVHEPSFSKQTLYWLLTQLTSRRIPTFVNCVDHVTAVEAARAGACAVTFTGTDAKQLREVDNWVIVRRRGKLQGSDRVGLIFQVLSALVRDVAQLKDGGIRASRILLDPDVSGDINPVQAAILMDSIHLMTAHRYPVIVEPYKKTSCRHDRLAILASSQLRTLFGGVDFIRARGVVEVAQASALADRMLATVA